MKTIRLWTIITVFMCFCGVAYGSPPDPGTPSAEDLAPYGDWVRGLRNPTTNIGCCSLSDCRVVDYRIGANGHYEAFIDSKTYHDGPNKWVEVPDSVILHESNPSGFGVACWAKWHPDTSGFFCFVPASGT